MAEVIYIAEGEESGEYKKGPPISGEPEIKNTQITHGMCY